MYEISASLESIVVAEALKCVMKPRQNAVVARMRPISLSGTLGVAMASGVSSGAGEAGGSTAKASVAASNSAANTRLLRRPVILECFTARGMPQLAKRLRFDLTDPFAGDAELLTDFLERTLVAILEAEA